MFIYSSSLYICNARGAWKVVELQINFEINLFLMFSLAFSQLQRTTGDVVRQLFNTALAFIHMKLLMMLARMSLVRWLLVVRGLMMRMLWMIVLGGFVALGQPVASAMTARLGMMWSDWHTTMIHILLVFGLNVWMMLVMPCGLVMISCWSHRMMLLVVLGQMSSVLWCRSQMLLCLFVVLDWLNGQPKGQQHCGNDKKLQIQIACKELILEIHI